MKYGNHTENEKWEGSKKKKGCLRELIDLVIYVGVVLGLAYFIVTYVGQRTKVIGYSMEYTLKNNDQLIVDKMTYRFSDPQRFDIIVFPFDKENGVYYIKRIIGLPGETVQIIGSDIYIDGEVLSEGYGKEKIEYAGLASEAITLTKDEYFVMGDNRNASSDSRVSEVGNIKRSDILGRAWLRIWPIKNFGILKHQ